MSKTIHAALLYFAIVLGTGFVLGMFRVPLLVTQIGERRRAKLAEMPIMAAVIFLPAGHLLLYPRTITGAGVLEATVAITTQPLASRGGGSNRGWDS